MNRRTVRQVKGSRLFPDRGGFHGTGTVPRLLDGSRPAVPQNKGFQAAVLLEIKDGEIRASDGL